jgi:hypothetical protein
VPAVLDTHLVLGKLRHQLGLVRPSPALSFALHADPRLLAQAGGMTCTMNLRNSTARATLVAAADDPSRGNVQFNRMMT